MTPDPSTELSELLMAGLGRSGRPAAEIAADWARSGTAPQAPEGLVAELVRRVRNENQFSELTSADLAALEQTFAHTAARISELASAGHEQELTELVERHAAEVERVVGPHLGAGPRRAISRQYTPSLQLAILGLTLAELRDPVLDVGCGSRAALVRFLKAEAHDARGIDRDAPRDVAEIADWLEYDYGVERWGTVLSHLGFSLHFLHQHLAASQSVAAYAKAYLAILRSLRAGGTFAYAPSLPFIEAHLPDARFVLERSALAGALTSALAPLRDETGLDLGSATRVRRVG